VRASAEIGFEELAITLVHTRRVGSLRSRHRDPVATGTRPSPPCAACRR
jgi:PIN domain nuclease of toxin-antitoxin system